MHMYLNHNKKESLKELESILYTMQLANDFLVSNNLTPKLKKLYFDNGLKSDVDNFIKHLHRFIKNPHRNNNFPYTEASKLLIKLNKAVKLHEEHYYNDLEKIKKIEIIILLGILFMLFLLVIFIFIPTKRDIELHIKEIKFQNEQIKQQDLNILAQAKSAQMGEMIGNIAHQWRQPLSVISTAITGMQMQKECGVLDDKTFDTNCTFINDNIQFLSTTINTFRDYLKDYQGTKSRKDDITVLCFKA